MFLYVLEDGEIMCTCGIQDGDKESCDAGILTMIDISGNIPKMYYADEWHNIKQCTYWSK